MNTKVLMLISSLFMGLSGVAASFFPQELLSFTGVSPQPLPSILLQLMGALYLGFSFLNFQAKSILIGGIYARPLALGNFTHFMVGALAIIKGAFSNPDLASLWGLGFLYAVFAICFSIIIFTHPLKTKSSAPQYS